MRTHISYKKEEFDIDVPDIGDNVCVVTPNGAVLLIQWEDSLEKRIPVVKGIIGVISLNHLVPIIPEVYPVTFVTVPPVEEIP